MVDTPTTTVPDTATLSAATSGDGTKLYVSLDGTTWTEVAELDDDDGLTDLPSGDQTTYETTHMGSGDFKEFKKNARREGTETDRSEEHTSELQSLMRISYDVFCLQKKTQKPED